MVFTATASTRRAFSLISSTILAAVSKSPPVHRWAMLSKAPLTITVRVSPTRLTVHIRLRWESKGSSSSRGYF